MIRSTSILCTILGLVFTCPAQASDDSREARILYRKGSLAFDEGDDVLARKCYLESLELEESFEAMCNLARTEARSDLFVEAYEHIRMCLYLFPEDEELQAAREKYAGLRNHIRAEITYEQAYPIDEKVEEEIERRENEEAVVKDRTIQTEPTNQVETSANEKEKVSSAKVPVTVTVGALGVVGLGTGAVFMWSAASHRKKALNINSELPGDSACVDPSPDERCGQLHEHIEKSNSNRNAGVVSYAIGGTLLAGAVVTYLLWPKPKRELMQATLSVERTGGFVSLAGTF